MANSKNEWGLNIGVLNIFAMIVVLVILGGVGVLADKNRPAAKATDQQILSVQAVTYDGEEGQTALDLLKTKADAQYEDSSIGVFVTSINGVANDDNHFWMYYVNGELAQISADQYQTKNSDKIEWRYEAIQ